MGPEEELAIRQAVQEASASWVSQLQEVLKQAVGDALREALPTELRKALSPELATLREELRSHVSLASPPSPSGAHKMENLQNITSLRRRSSMLPSAKLIAAFQPKGHGPGMQKVRTGSVSNVDSLDVEPTRSIPVRHSRTESIPKAKLESILAGRLKSTEDNTTEPLPAPHSASPVPVDLSLQEAPILEQASEDYMQIDRSGSGLDMSERSKEDEEDEEAEGSVDTLAMAPGQPGTLRNPSMSILPDFLDTPRLRLQEQQGTPRKDWRQTLRNLLMPFKAPAQEPPREASKVRGLLLKKHDVEVKGRPGRRGAVVLREADVVRVRHRRFPFSQWSWPFADPGGRPRQYWEIFACTLLLLQLLYLCFQAGFITLEDYRAQGHWELKMSLLVVDIFWVIDLGINFTTGYRDVTHVLHSSARSNAWRYLRGGFALDLLATLPSLLLHVLLVIDPQAYGFWPLRMMGLSPLLRSFRIRGAYTLLKRLEANMKSSVVSSAWWLCQLFMLPLVFSHLSACALWSLGYSNLEADAETSSWIKLGLDISNEPGALQAVPLGERYTTAMYFAITVMSTVGLGDINMSLSNERALLCVIMATTSLVVGVAVNGVATIVSKLSERTAANMEQLAQVSKFLKVYRVPRELQSRVHDYLLQVFENREREETKSMLMGWLKKSEVLRTKVNLALTGTCLVQHRWLKLLPPEVLANVCDLCDTEFHPPQQELIAEGAMVKSCFYIRSGLVQTRNRVGGQAWAATSSDDTEESDEIQKEIEAADAASPDARLQGGAFIGEFRLFLGVSRSLKTVTCLSFCELISIDVSKFESLMSEAMPELFDILVIYAAIDHDCPKAMLHCLEQNGISPEMPLLFGEGVLHHCAKVNAAACAEHLMEDLDQDAAQARDQDGRTPAQVAAALKHKKTFWAMIQGSGRTSVTDVDVLPREARTARAKNSQTIALAPSAWTDRDEEPYTMARVQQLFATCNRNGLAASTGESSKDMEDLVEELNTCQSDLLVMNVRGGMQQTLLRRVRLVRLRLLAVIDDNVHALVELTSDAWLRARDQKLGKLPYRRMRKRETEEEATKNLMQELGISVFLFEEELIVPIAKSCYAETRTSMSYPGLETEYVVYESTWKVRAQALHRTEEIGLPNGRPFQKEFCTDAFRVVTRQLFWPVLLNFTLNEKHADERGGETSWALKGIFGKQALSAPSSPIM
ncbi:KCNH6 [Symbiodinium sp. CCMP2456]|nr:KCNH6 [Symbiodinium sp. CCMP2456]